jgi:hypothetical protein
VPFNTVGNLFWLPEDGNLQNARPVPADQLARLTASDTQATQAEAEATMPTQPAPETKAPPGIKTETSTPATPAAPPTSSAHKRADYSSRTWHPWAPRAESRLAPVLCPDTQHLPRASLLSGIPVIPRHHIFREAAAAPSTTPENATSAHTSIASHDQPEPLHQEQIQSAHQASPPVVPSASEPVAAAGVASSSVSTPDATVAAMPPAEKNVQEGFVATTHKEQESAQPRQGFGFWRTLASALVTLLVFMLVCAALIWALRETLMTRWPTSQPFYLAACEQLGCHALPVRDIDGLGVAQPTLRRMSDARHLELTLPIHNHLDVALAWPAINLTLLDGNHHAVTQRVLRPEDYVRPVAAVDTGLAARSVQTMTVQVDAGNVAASNFHLDIFYP